MRDDHLIPDIEPIRRFFAALFEQGATGQCIELRALPRAARIFVPVETPAEAERFIKEHAQQNLYVGVALRRTGGGGGLSDCVALPALFTDIDFKTTPVEQARAAVRRFPLEPSVVVRSGGGVHVYWLLREPMVLPEEAWAAKDLLRRIAHYLGGDLSAAEPARILRLPGTRNFKYTPPAAVELARLDAERRFNPSDFDFLPPEPAAAGDRTPRFALPEQIPAGERNTMLYAYARSLKGRGLGELEILVLLTAANQEHCHPPLEQQELHALTHHAAVQMDRPGFGDDPPRGRRHFTVEVWP